MKLTGVIYGDDILILLQVPVVVRSSHTGLPVRFVRVLLAAVFAGCARCVNWASERSCGICHHVPTSRATLLYTIACSTRFLVRSLHLG